MPPPNRARLPGSGMNSPVASHLTRYGHPLESALKIKVNGIIIRFFPFGFLFHQQTFYLFGQPAQLGVSLEPTITAPCLDAHRRTGAHSQHRSDFPLPHSRIFCKKPSGYRPHR